MTDLEISALTMVAFRFMSIVAGLTLAFIGYRLFVLGVFNQAGDINVVWGDRKLLIKRAAPGTLFAVAGAAVLFITLFQKPSTKIQDKTKDFGTQLRTERDLELQHFQARIATLEKLSKEQQQKLSDLLDESPKNGRLEKKGSHSMLKNEATPPLASPKAGAIESDGDAKAERKTDQQNESHQPANSEEMRREKKIYLAPTF